MRIIRIHPACGVGDGLRVADDALGNFGTLHEGNIVVVQPAAVGALLRTVACDEVGIDRLLRVYRLPLADERVRDVYLHGKERRELRFFDVSETDHAFVEDFVQDVRARGRGEELISAVDTVDIDGNGVFNHFLPTSEEVPRGSSASGWRRPPRSFAGAAYSRSAPSQGI